MDAEDDRILIAGSELGNIRHVCAFFNSPDDEYEVLLPFIKEGLERGEKAFHVVDPEQPERHRGRRYKANFNRVPRTRDPVICTYDVSNYSGAFIVEVMRTHPMIIVGGILQENPFYVPPEEFVRELQGRRAIWDSGRT